MKANFNLTISNPCNEKWENFTPTPAGGFCGSCNKVVVDFTKMTDGQILDYFQTHHGHTCGRLHPYQLKLYARETTVQVRPGMTILKAGLISLLLALVSKPSNAQQSVPRTKTDVVDQSKSPVEETQTIAKEQILKGVVLSETDGEPLAGANIVLQGTPVGTTADANGRFEFPQKVKEGDIILIYFIGFETKEYQVPKISGAPLEIEMRCDYQIMGELAIDTPFTEEPSGLERLWSKVKAAF